MKRYWLGLLMVTLALSGLARGQIVGWRGDGSGKAKGETLWSWRAGEKVAWTAEVGKSYSSPVVVGDKVLVTAEPNWLICLELKSGRELWRQANGFEQVEGNPKDPKDQTSCGYSTPTPVSDGKRVYALFGTGIVACYDLEGKRQWITWIEQSPITPYGRSASPILVGEKLIVPVSHFVALEAGSGKLAWDQGEADASYGTPLVMELGNKKVVITSTGYVLDPENGNILADDLPTVAYSSPVIEKDVVYFADTTAAAAQLAWKGEKVAVKVLWEQPLEGEFFASPILHEGLLYTSNSAAGYSVLDAATGAMVLNKTLELPPAGKPGSNGPYVYPSLVLAGGKVLVSSTSGETFALEAGREYKEAGRSQVGDELSAGPVFAGGRALFRVGEKLVCVEGAGNPKGQEPTTNK